jgi:molybdopterin-guanine dinucleotide biosynthesis protein A
VFERALAAGRLAIRDALAELDVAVVTIEPARLANANTPAELARLLDAPSR